MPALRRPLLTDVEPRRTAAGPVRCTLLGEERPSESRPYPEEVEIRGRHEADPDALRLPSVVRSSDEPDPFEIISS
jgi:hypothetical protein